MRPLSLAFVSLFLSLSLDAAVVLRVAPAGKDRIDIRAQNASLHALAGAIAMRMNTAVSVDLPDRSVDFKARDITPATALNALAQQERLRIVIDGDSLILRDATEATVTIDVKDADVHEVMATIQSQCGIRNMVIDPGVQGKGTFLFNQVPCGVAIRTVLRTLGLEGETLPSSVVHVTR
jgi:hypothetical protein